MLIPLHIRTSQSGFTLLEVLVAILVLSIGLLGNAKLQVYSLRAGQDALTRSSATMLAEELAERIHANVAGATANAYSTANAYYSGGVVTTAAVNCNVLPTQFCSSRFNGTVQITAASCSTTQMAQYDFYTFACGIDGTAATGGVAALPGGSGTLTANVNSSYTITVSWSGLDSTGVPAPASITYTVVP